jgi:hypothetical protein
MLKFLSSNFSHDTGIVNEDALRALIYISWFSGDIVDIIQQLILEAMEQLSTFLLYQIDKNFKINLILFAEVYVTLENTPKGTITILIYPCKLFINSDRYRQFVGVRCKIFYFEAQFARKLDNNFFSTNGC